MKADDGVVSEELVGADGDCEVLAQTGGAIVEVHRRHVGPGSNPLVQSGENAEAELADCGTDLAGDPVGRGLVDAMEDACNPPPVEAQVKSSEGANDFEKGDL